MFKTVSVIGLGYIGLPTAAMLASCKVNVIGVDINQYTVDTINKGQIHIVEPELDILVAAAVSQGYLWATNKPEPADAFLIAVPTPFIGDHEPDISFVEASAKSIAPVLKRGDLVILESTSPVGTTEQIADWLAIERPDLSFPQHKGEEPDVNIAYCPERVLPGKIVHELVSNDRVIGGLTTACSKRATELYKIFVSGSCTMTNARTAEMCKLTENSFRDVNIAFANELSIICDSLNINVWELINLANHHPRVNILQPGPGVGGHCIAVDPWFIVAKSPDESKLIRVAREVNDSKPNWVITKINSSIQEFLKKNKNLNSKDITIACLGLAFKPDVDDLRESPAFAITQLIANQHDGLVLAVEPNVKDTNLGMSSKVKITSLRDALDTAHIVVILVGHKEFKNISEERWGAIDKVIDACGIISAA